MTSGNTVRIVDAESGELLRTLTAHANSIRSANFSPDGKRIVAGGFPDNIVRI